MLRLVVVQEVRRLLDQGNLSQRKIATLAGVSRGTVQAIASGQRAIFGRESEPEEHELFKSDAPVLRCPGCGAMATMPCLLCRARNHRTCLGRDPPATPPKRPPRRAA